MPLVTLNINAREEIARLPVIWRLGRKFNVVTSIRRARVSSDFAYVALDVEGSTQEVEQAGEYLRGLGVTGGGGTALVSLTSSEPENTVSQANTIHVQLRSVNTAQNGMPILYRLGKDFNVVVNIENAAFDEEEGGTIQIALSGPLGEIQRAIAYLHTTGVHVDPKERCVTDYSNL